MGQKNTNPFKAALLLLVGLLATSPFSVNAQTFNLVSPPDSTVLPLSGADNQTVTASWTTANFLSGTPATYRWLADLPGGDFSAPLLSVISNNAGLDTVMTLTYAQTAAALQSLGFAPGANVILDWTVEATDGVDTVFATAPFYLTIQYGNLFSQLPSFSLLSPPDSTILALNGSASQQVNIAWESVDSVNGNAVTYEWVASFPGGNLSNPLLSIPADNLGMDTMLTLSYGAIGNALLSLGLISGQSISLDWSVRATDGVDTTFALAPFYLTIAYGSLTEDLPTFTLISPPDSAVLNLSGSSSQTVTPTWHATAAVNGNPIVYEFLADLPGGDFSSPLLTLTANNSGSDTAITLPYSAVAAALQALGFNPGQIIALDWTVRAADGYDTILAAAPHYLTIVYGTVYNDLAAFNLLTPASGTNLSLSGVNTQQVNVTWKSVPQANAPSNVTYEWLADLPGGSFANPLLVIPANNSGADTMLTLGYGAIGQALSSLGFNPGQSALLSWTVRATDGLDTILATTPFLLTLTYGTIFPPIDSFNLLTPPNNAVVTVAGLPSQLVNIRWNTASNPNGNLVTYTWIADTTADLSTPILPLPSNNAGQDTVLTLNYGTLDIVMAGYGLAIGDSLTLFWSVNATDATLNTTRRATQVWRVTLVRGLVQDFLTAFNLLTPANNARVFVNGLDNQTANITWSASINPKVGGAAVTYEWLANAPGLGFTNPPITIGANNVGSSAALTLSYLQLDGLLASTGLAVGDSVTLEWTVLASAGTSSTLTRFAEEVRTIKLVRGDVYGLGLANDPSALPMTVYPVPAQEQLFIEMPTATSVRRVALLDMAGREVLSQGNPAAGRRQTLNVANLQSGTYLLRVETAQGTAQRSVVIAR